MGWIEQQEAERGARAKSPNCWDAKRELLVSLESDVLGRAYGHAVAYLEALDTRPVATTVGLAKLRERLDIPLQNGPRRPKP